MYLHVQHSLLVMCCKRSKTFNPYKTKRPKLGHLVFLAILSSSYRDLVLSKFIYFLTKTCNTIHWFRRYKILPHLKYILYNVINKIVDFKTVSPHSFRGQSFCYLMCTCVRGYCGFWYISWSTDTFSAFFWEISRVNCAQISVYDALKARPYLLTILAFWLLIPTSTK